MSDALENKIAALESEYVAMQERLEGLDETRNMSELTDEETRQNMCDRDEAINSLQELNAVISDYKQQLEFEV